MNKIYNAITRRYKNDYNHILNYFITLIKTADTKQCYRLVERLESAQFKCPKCFGKVQVAQSSNPLPATGWLGLKAYATDSRTSQSEHLNQKAPNSISKATKKKEQIYKRQCSRPQAINNTILTNFGTKYYSDDNLVLSKLSKLLAYQSQTDMVFWYLQLVSTENVY